MTLPSQDTQLQMVRVPCSNSRRFTIDMACWSRKTRKLVAHKVRQLRPCVRRTWLHDKTLNVIAGPGAGTNAEFTELVLNQAHQALRERSDRIVLASMPQQRRAEPHRRSPHTSHVRPTRSSRQAVHATS